MENTEPASHQGQPKRLRGHPRLRGEVVYGAHWPPRREPAELIELASRWRLQRGPGGAQSSPGKERDTCSRPGAD